MTSPELHKRCLDCGYILDRLPELRCPECGRAFDPGDPTTYVVRPKCGVPYLVAALGAVCGLLAGCSAAAVVLRYLSWFLNSEFVVVGVCLVFLLVIGSILSGSWTASRCIKALDLPPAALCHRSCCKIALGLATPFKALNLLVYLPPEGTLVLVVLVASWRARVLSC